MRTGWKVLIHAERWMLLGFVFCLIIVIVEVRIQKFIFFTEFSELSRDFNATLLQFFSRVIHTFVLGCVANVKHSTVKGSIVEFSFSKPVKWVEKTV